MSFSGMALNRKQEIGMHTIAKGLMILGGLFILIAAWLLFTAFESYQWPKVEGTITETKVVARVRQVDRPIHRYLDYAVEIRYRYFFNKKLYHGTRYSIGTGGTVAGDFNSRIEAKDWMAQSPYQTGRPIDVYVNPKDPAFTVIKRGFHWANWVPFILGLLMIVLGFVSKTHHSHNK